MCSGTVVVAVGECHHLDWDRAAVSTVEHPLLGQFGVKRNLPQALEVKSVQEYQTGLVSQRSRYQELRDGTCNGTIEGFQRDGGREAALRRKVTGCL